MTTMQRGLSWALRFAVVAAGLGSALASSSISGTDDDETCGYTFVGPDSTTVNLVVGQTATINARFNTPCAHPIGFPSARFSTANPLIASVSPSSGQQTVVTGVGPGTTIVSVEGTPVAVTVRVAAGGISITPASQRINQGQTVTLTATVRDGAGGVLTDPAYVVTWGPTGNAVATVTKTGDRTASVTGTAPGVITVTATVGAVSSTAQITVVGNTLVVAPASATLLINGTTLLTATLTDGTGAVVTGTPVTWTSADNNTVRITPAAAPSATATATGLVVGGPIAVTATAGGLSAISQITVVAAPPPSGRIAYALADRPTTASYTAAPANAFNSAGGAITIARTGLGLYGVTFAGQQTPSGKKETVMVSAVGAELEICRVASWSSTATALVADIRCTDSDGDLADQAFSILLIGNDALSGRFGFTLADQPTPSAPYSPAAATTFSSSSQPVTVARGAGGAGSYTVGFAGLDRVAASDREAFIVTPVGIESERCGVSSTSAIAAKVQCVRFDGSAVNSKFNITLFGNDPNRVLGFASPLKDLNPTSTPPAGSTYNKSGGAVSTARLGTGRTEITFAGLATAAGSSVMNVQMTGSDGSGECKLLGWRVSGANIVTTVQCFDRFESADDLPYTIVIVR